MSKNWLISDKIKDNFAELFPQYDRLTLQLLKNRDLTEKEAIEEFLNADYERYSHDPFLFKDMRAAVDLIIAKIKTGEKITVYGDYDADGVTSTALLMETLKTLKAEVEVYIPDRVSEGYGLNNDAIKEIYELDTKLLITVDNGIRGKDEVAYAKSLGLEVIVTDHHLPPNKIADLPDCLVIDPIITTDAYPFKYLAGVGTAFKLAAALIRTSSLTAEDKTKLEERNLDLVALGTVADCVKLLGENRVLVKKGLEILNKTKRLGLLELIKAAKINNGKLLDSWNIGFQLAPRLNAAGRMDHANTAFELIVTKDKAEAEQLARDLSGKNSDRQQETESIVNQIERTLAAGLSDKIIIAVSPSIYGGSEQWNEGVIGLAAGRLMEKYYLPAMVITGNEADMKGSGRSIPEFNLMTGIEKIHGSLARYGGHAAACGFSIVGKENLKQFISELKILAEQALSGLDLQRKILIDAEIDFSEVNEQLVEIIDRFAPFGEENDRPKFLSHNLTVVDMINLGPDGRHLKLRVKNGQTGVKSALGFGQSGKWPDLRIGDKIDLVYYPEINEFNGKREIQLKIVDLRQASK
jgi:single-stranded-DNA-specific exonuclease